MLDPSKITVRLLTEADFLAYHGACSWHSIDAKNGVLEVANLEIAGDKWSKTHNAIEANLTDPGVTVCNIHNLWIREMRIVNANEHGDGIRIKGAANPPGPIVNVYDIRYDRLSNGFLPLFCGEGYIRELNIWNTEQSAGADGGWPQQWIGSANIGLLRVYNSFARTCVQSNANSVRAINVDSTAVYGRFSVNAGPSPQVVPWTPPAAPVPPQPPTPTPPPVNPPVVQMADVDAFIVLRHGNPARAFISGAKQAGQIGASLTIDGEQPYAAFHEVPLTKLLGL